ncbi:MAG TPA: type VI secretion system membrane subunit TssM, partial [Acetobacteraceae bacterium]|nr:type VI secretion system membrane subunit TssM [Acetobacteraceae bacterium]
AAEIDAWEESFAAPLGLMTRPREARSPAGNGGAPRPFFVAGVFRDFVFPEAGLGGRNPKLERRTALIHMGGYLACVLGLIASASLWFGEFNTHRLRLQAFAASAAQEATLARSPGTRSAIAALLPLLDEARGLAREAPNDTLLEQTIGFTPLDIENVLNAATLSYDRLLKTRYLPLLQSALESQLQEAVAAGNNPSRIRALLTVYLMLGDAKHFSRANVGPWGSAFLGTIFALDPDRRADALAHWQPLLALMPLPVSLNASLIQGARALLQSRPDAELIYGELQADAAGSNAAFPLDVAGSLGAGGAQLLMLRSQAGLPVVVPALYTRDGFYKIFLKEAPLLVRRAVEGDWVVGGIGGGPDAAQSTALLQQVTNDYVRDYIKQWQAILNQIVLRALPDIASVVAGLQVMAGPDSPVMQLIALVKNQTDLPVPPPEPSPLAQLAAGAKAVGGAGPLAAAAVQQVPGSQPANPLPGTSWPGDAIRAPFAPLLALLKPGGAGQAPALGVQDAITSAYGVVSGIAAAQSPEAAAAQAAAQVISGQGGDPLIRLRVEAATLPHPMNEIFSGLYLNIWNVLLQLTREHIQAAWAQSVAPVCEQSIAGRFPFVAAGAALPDLDVTLQDFASFFGRRGVLDQFVAGNLAPFTLSGAGNALSLASQDGLSLGLPGDVLAEINQARRIQALFFDTSGNLAVTFSLTPSYLDPRVLSATLAINQTNLVYQHQPPRATEFRWPNPNA